MEGGAQIYIDRTWPSFLPSMTEAPECGGHSSHIDQGVILSTSVRNAINTRGFTFFNGVKFNLFKKKG